MCVHALPQGGSSRKGTRQHQGENTASLQLNSALLVGSGIVAPDAAQAVVAHDDALHHTSQHLKPGFNHDARPEFRPDCEQKAHALPVRRSMQVLVA
jgi:hypothetical protein